MAKINDQDIDALRERADIVDIVSGYTTLKRSGGNTFKGLCPFHAEKTPSFTVDSAKNLFFCFGCQEGGNIYHFIQKVENLDFPAAAEWLARRVGFDLRYEEMRPGEKKASAMKLRIIAANEAAARFFHESLMATPEASEARRYLGGRGFDREVAERWRLGFAPGRDALTKRLLSAGFTQEELTAADLVRKSDRDGSLYDTFRGRVVFPTWNLQGDVVGFGARALGDAQPKYLNTSETPVFQKSRLMYGLDRAKSAMGRGEPAVVVEGYTDVIALHEANISTAVATNGVALGEGHFDVLKKFTQRAVLMFDADEAGRGATERGFALQFRLGLDVLVAPLPEGGDPADVVNKDGAERIRKVIEEAQPLMEFKLEQTIARLPLDTPEAKGRAVREVSEVLGWHPDPVARHEYAFMVARRIGVEVDVVHRALSERRTQPVHGEGGTVDRRRVGRLPGHVKVEREALRLLLTSTKQAGPLAIDIAESDFTAPPRREVYRHAMGLYRSGESSATARTAEGLSADGFSLLTELTVGEPGGPDDEPALRAAEIFDRLRVFRLEREIKARRNTLQEVNPLVDPTRHDELFTELVSLEAERRDLIRKLQGAV
jgi:DNA primase